MMLYDAAIVTLVLLVVLFAAVLLYGRWRRGQYARKHPPLPAPAGYTVTLTERGRSGTVDYADDAGSTRFFWEFGGAGVVVIVMVPSADEWSTAVPWAAHRRAEILDRVAREVWRQRCRACTWTIDETSIEFRESA